MSEPRFEVYNKDPDFFFDRETGCMYCVNYKGSFDGRKIGVHVGDPEVLVARIVDLLNKDEEKSKVSIDVPTEFVNPQPLE